MAKQTETAKGTKEKAKTLVIVESPSKAKTISKYLGSSYKVMASIGHIRDLPKSKLGIDVNNDFEPEYIAIRGKGDLIKELKKEAKLASKVYLATDPDREGEAISWHLAYILGLNPEENIRIEFHEITKDAIKTAIKQPRAINLKLVDAQQARRVLDRLVGYKISPLLWRKISRGLSAGRVQSAALKIICDRERLINEFEAKEYWNVTAKFKKGKTFEAKVFEKGGKKIEIHSKGEADKVINDLEKGTFKVGDIQVKDRIRKPFPAFTTSSLQQDAANKIGFTTRKTMMIAQQLYEGVDIKGKGTVGLVTYIRTDSVRVSEEAKKNAKEYITRFFGEKYVGNNVFVNKKKDIQDAHEAIRPSNIELDPDMIKDSLTKDQYNLYHLIWTRFLASQMAASEFSVKTLSIENGDYTLKANGSIRTFDGYQKIYQPNIDEDKDNIIPELSLNEEIKAQSVSGEQKFTEPPARFTEASLVKDLEDKNIGRPSTYSPIISTLIDRGYIKRSKRVLIPTSLGFAVTDEVMTKYFKEISDTGFTADLEDKLDDVEVKGIAWREVIRPFYATLVEEIAFAESDLKRIELPAKVTDEICEKCGKPMIIKESRFGEFLACSGYPECTNTKSITKKIGITCPECGGDIVAKTSKRGKLFYGCGNFPRCNKAYWYKPIDKKCPLCGELLVERKHKNGEYTCSNAECTYKE